MWRLAVVFGLAFGALAAPALGQATDARGGWHGYAWKRISLTDCDRFEQQTLCPLYHEKWDWKRNQWVDITLVLRPGQIDLSQRLTNRDRRDDDFVCVTAIVMDASGRALAIHHQNWHSDPGEEQEESFSYPLTRAREPAALLIGSRQCRKGGHEDDDVYAQALAAIIR